MNRRLTKSVKRKVPQEAWTGMKHSVSHLKVFGWVSYAHVPDELRKKIDFKGEKCIFFGHFEDTKAYKLFNPITRKVISSRDVLFVEDEAWYGTIERKVNITPIVPHDEVFPISNAPQPAPSSTPGTTSHVVAQAAPSSI